jgi:hypothetical protein
MLLICIFLWKPELYRNRHGRLTHHPSRPLKDRPMTMTRGLIKHYRKRITLLRRAVPEDPATLE